MARSPEAEFAHHTGLLADLGGSARKLGAASWLYLGGGELAAVDDVLRPTPVISERATLVHSAECRDRVEQELRELSDDCSRSWAGVAR